MTQNQYYVQCFRSNLLILVNIMVTNIVNVLYDTPFFHYLPIASMKPKYYYHIGQKTLNLMLLLLYYISLFF